MDLDLHMHSTASDGTVSPAGVVAAAVEGRLDVIALTDHDTVGGVLEARAAASGFPLEVIPALEVSSTWEEGEIHILGYFVDPTHPPLVAHGEFARTRRAERMQGMIDLLADEGVEVAFESVLEAAGFERSNLGRPHLARALLEGGYVASLSEAFDRFIGNAHPAYIPTRLLTLEEGVGLILDAGGVPVWAHPPVEHLDALLPRLVRAGLRGVEVFRPRNSRDRTLLLERTARSAGLVVSGGSDWHGPDDGPLGGFRVQSREVGRLLELGGM
jgi:3',5'-nucleoside bisphosphate phosphatase